jgi:hypothetical protein
MNKSILSFTILVLLLCNQKSLAQKRDTVYMKDNQMIVCKIYKIRNNRLHYYTFFHGLKIDNKVNLKDIEKYTLHRKSKIEPDIKYDSLPKPVVDETYPSFRIKTELFQWAGLKPNIYFEYKFRKRTALELGFLYNFTGVTWSAPYFTLGGGRGGQYRWVECWTLKGYSIGLGYKYYFRPTKYLAIKCKGDFLNFGGSIRTSERRQDQQSEIMNRKDVNLQILVGFENKRKSNYFREIYLGLGVMSINEKHSVLKNNVVNGYYLGRKYVDSKIAFVVPTIHFGINIGWKSIPKKHR